MGSGRRRSIGFGIVPGVNRYLVVFKTPGGGRLPSAVKKAIRYGKTIQEARDKIHKRNEILSIEKIKVKK